MRTLRIASMKKNYFRIALGSLVVCASTDLWALCSANIFSFESHEACLARESQRYDQPLERSRQRAQDALDQLNRPPPNPFMSQPSLGVFSGPYVFINGESIQYEKNPERVIELVRQGAHRRITGQYLPPGYSMTYPESMEQFADKLEKQRGIGGRIQGWLK